MYDPKNPYSSAAALRQAYRQAMAEGTGEDHSAALLAILKKLREED
jgi:hypothetical protein